MNEVQKLIDEYSEEYCLFLEAAYGPNMMSEGGLIAIDRMFAGIHLTGKSLLDVGAGLGGVAFYLASQHQANIIGLELGTWMVSEATRRIPDEIKSRIKFTEYQPPILNFADASFDLIYSKGVLTHVKDKLPLFKEIYRVLKPQGIFLIEDWLSPVQHQWGARLQKMCEIENLTLYAETEGNYIEILHQADFQNIKIRDENTHYAQYNQDIVAKLESMKMTNNYTGNYGGISLQQTIDCYQLIADSIKDNELLIRWIKCIK